jgi:hypothetical protein
MSLSLQPWVLFIHHLMLVSVSACSCYHLKYRNYCSGMQSRLRYTTESKFLCRSGYIRSGTVKPVKLATCLCWPHIGGTGEVPVSLYIRLPF